ncbi:MAG: hypothetical protein HP002_02440 [Lentisphaeria bacterium]|jgi:hypothetical protein|nr:hypothetical protein [Lentisphaeria bacterium]
MRRIFAIALTALLFAGAVVLACFDSDPDSLLGNDTTTITGENGSSFDVAYPIIPGFNPDEWLDQWEEYQNEQEKLTKIVPVAAIQTAFPFTLNIAFSGFLDEQGQQVTEKIGRLTLYYYSKSGEWMVLKTIENPEYEIVSTAGKSRALFGRHTIPSPMGYSSGQYIPIVFHFQTKSGRYSSFNLNEFWGRRQHLGAPNFAQGANVLAIIVRDNTKPY